MNASCRCCLGVQGSETLWRAANNGLWLVHSRNCRPSRAYLKWRMAVKAASSSLSKAEYFHSVEDNFLEKKPSGRQPFTSRCCRTPPMWVSDASAVKNSSAWCSGCACGTASTRASLMAVKDTCMSVDHTRTFGLPLMPLGGAAECGLLRAETCGRS